MNFHLLDTPKSISNHEKVEYTFIAVIRTLLELKSIWQTSPPLFPQIFRKIIHLVFGGQFNNLH
jgi:hypothetical protein